MPKQAIVIGSGFGGAVTACRLAQAALNLGGNELNVLLLERGRRYGKDDFPRLQLPESMTSNPDLQSSQRVPDFSRYSWRTDYGLYDARNLGGLMVLQAAGLGGGSLIYANVLLRAPERVLAAWPEPYRGARLNPYYGLAEYVLGAMTAPNDYTKTQHFERAAKALERKVINVPLAIRFPPADGSKASPTNRYGKAQGQCNGCGDCVIGCTLHAKNTLDLNYIAQFERVATDRPDLARVWTLAEVTRIGRLPAQEGSKSFEITVVRHDQGETEIRIEADYVFLCAGAIGSTELLMNNWGELGLGKTKPRALGKRLFGNGDSLGVVFDTEKAGTPWSGPTITRAIVHAEKPVASGNAAPREPLWFMVQDGGIPPTLRQALGYFHGGIWLGRNRFVTPKERRALRPSPGPLTDLFLDLPVLAGLFSRRGEPRSKDDDEPVWRRYAPKDFWPLLKTLTDPDGRLRREVELLDQRVMQRLQSEFGRRYGLASWFPAISNIINTSVLTESVLGALRDRFAALGYLPQSGKLSEGLLKLATFLLLGHGPSANSAVFLCMGPDHEWHLRRRNDGTLRADRDLAGSRQDVELYGAQERLLRDLNWALRGELRTNPDWTVGKRAVTVHTQGGAGMPRSPDVDPGDSITDEYGRVRAGNGLALYVMDAAGFPTSVGVNPSLTIAAVAEYKVEHFIRNTLKLKDWTNASREQGFAVKAEQTDLIEKALNEAAEKSPEFRHGSVGIEWHERMDGSAAETTTVTPPNARDCPALDKKGLSEGRHIAVELDCQVLDLEAFYLRRPPTVELKGTVTVREARELPELFEHREGQVFDCTGSLTLSMKLGRLVSMNYDLALVARTSPPGKRPSGRLIGTKFIHDDPGMDAFIDLTTLNIVIDFGAGVRPLVGVVRVPMATFIAKQLPTFKLSHVEDLDDTGKLWAAARFSQFFFGTIKETFLPEFFVKRQVCR